MKLDDILTNWQKDVEIDKSHLDVEILNIPKLHHKYLKILSQERLLYKELDREKKEIFQSLWMYYSGKADASVYKTHPLPNDLISNTKIKDYIEIDNKYINIQRKVDIANEKIEVLVEIIKEINARSYKIRNYIDWQKFISGEN